MKIRDQFLVDDFLFFILLRQKLFLPRCHYGHHGPPASSCFPVLASHLTTEVLALQMCPTASGFLHGFQH